MQKALGELLIRPYRSPERWLQCFAWSRFNPSPASSPVAPGQALCDAAAGAASGNYARLRVQSQARTVRLVTGNFVSPFIRAVLSGPLIFCLALAGMRFVRASVT